MANRNAARARNKRGIYSTSGHPPRPVGVLTLPIETIAPADPAGLRQVVDPIIGAAPPVLPRDRDPAGPLLLPDALTKGVPELPQLGATGQVQRALALLRALTDFRLPELGLFDTLRGRANYNTPAAPAATSFKAPRRSATAIGRPAPDNSP